MNEQAKQYIGLRNALTGVGMPIGEAVPEPPRLNIMTHIERLTDTVNALDHVLAVLRNKLAPLGVQESQPITKTTIDKPQAEVCSSVANRLHNLHVRVADLVRDVRDITSQVDLPEV